MINLNIPPTHNPFTVPEGYLSGLTNRVLAHCCVEQKPKAPVRLVPAWLPYAGVACVAALVAVFSCVMDVGLPDAEVAGTDNASQTQNADSLHTDATDYAYEYFAANNALGYYMDE